MNKHGRKWITDKRRLAIYLRDGLACCYCAAKIEEGAQLTLDHLRPRARGGDNKTGNLITACKPCNDRRQDKPWHAFTIDQVFGEVTPSNILKAQNAIARIRTQRRRSIARLLDTAAELIAGSGGLTSALYGAVKTKGGARV